MTTVTTNREHKLQEGDFITFAGDYKHCKFVRVCFGWIWPHLHDLKRYKVGNVMHSSFEVGL